MNGTGDKEWTADQLLELGRSYQGAAVLAAAADLEVFPLLAASPRPAKELARELSATVRGTTILLDALAALKLLDKQDGRYVLPPGLAPFLAADGRRASWPCASIRPIVCAIGQLARVIKEGQPALKTPSVRGQQADAEAFIGAMHNICAPWQTRSSKPCSRFAFGMCSTWRRFRHLDDGFSPGLP